MSLPPLAERSLLKGSPCLCGHCTSPVHYPGSLGRLCSASPVEQSNSATKSCWFQIAAVTDHHERSSLDWGWGCSSVTACTPVPSKTKCEIKVFNTRLVSWLWRSLRRALPHRNRVSAGEPCSLGDSRARLLLVLAWPGLACPAGDCTGLGWAHCTLLAGTLFSASLTSFSMTRTLWSPGPSWAVQNDPLF